jgi:hypothetical protein
MVNRVHFLQKILSKHLVIVLFVQLQLFSQKRKVDDTLFSAVKADYSCTPAKFSSERKESASPELISVGTKQTYRIFFNSDDWLLEPAKLFIRNDSVFCEYQFLFGYWLVPSKTASLLPSRYKNSGFAKKSHYTRRLHSPVNQVSQKSVANERAPPTKHQ